MVHRKVLVASLLVLPAFAGAQDPRTRKAPAMAAGFTGGAASTPAGLNAMFDAAKARPALAVPEKAEEVGSPNKPLPTMYRRPKLSNLHQQLVVPVPNETPAYKRTFKAMLANPDKTDKFDEMILTYSRIYKLDSRLLKSIMAAESEFNPQAVSPAGARGLMQVMPVTAAGVGVQPERLNEPRSGVKAGAAYLQVLFETAWRKFKLKGVRYTDAPMWVVQRVIAAYHAGPKFLTRLNLFPSTRAYVKKVVLFYHSKVSDLRRPANVALELPAYSESVTPSGSMY
ncbi:MAG: transglycosylase SLT domain-containing protein [Elusimicrobiota bacterium]|nr:MAG: transglycosylase SLT domain-containing protein [Elusimicrobiota bacterium]